MHLTLKDEYVKLNSVLNLRFPTGWSRVCWLYGRLCDSVLFRAIGLSNYKVKKGIRAASMCTPPFIEIVQAFLGSLTYRLIRNHPLRSKFLGYSWEVLISKFRLFNFWLMRFWCLIFFYSILFHSRGSSSWTLNFLFSCILGTCVIFKTM
jgi:hypothetical protein